MAIFEKSIEVNYGPRRSCSLKFVLFVVLALLLIGSLVIILPLVLIGNRGQPSVYDTPKPVLNATSSPSVPSAPFDPTRGLQVLREFSANINGSVDPCDDFYEYACGSFGEKHPLQGQQEVNRFTLELDEVYNEIVKSLNSESLSDETIPPLKYLKKIWDSCVHDTSSTAENLGKLNNYFRKLNKLDTLELKMSQVTRDGFNVFFTAKVAQNPRIAYGNILSLDSPKLELANSSPNVNLLDYYSHVVRMAQNAAAVNDDHVRLAEEIIEFENWLLANATSLDDKIRYPTEHTLNISLAQLEEASPMNWGAIINKTVGITRYSNRPISEVRVEDIKYLSNLKGILKAKNEYFLNEYIKFSVVEQSCVSLGHECRFHRWKLTHNSAGPFGDEMNNKLCFDALYPNLEDLMFKLYLQEAIEPYTKGVESLAIALGNEFKDLINKTSWMDAGSKKRAIDLIVIIKLLNQLRMPPWIKWDSDLEDKYSNVSYLNSTERVSFFDYFSTLVAEQKVQEFEILSEWGIKRSFASWGVPLFGHEPKFVHVQTSLRVPGPLTQGRFFDDSFPPEMNFGLLGSLMAHEVTHAIDAVADEYQTAYRHRRLPVWTPETRKLFKDRMKCIIGAYDGQKVVVNGSLVGQLNGTSTLNENLADLIGLNVAYNAYKTVATLKPGRLEYTGPFQNMSKDQMFFVSYANVHCTNDAKQAARDVQLGVRSPRKFRVNLSLAHTQKFSQTFACKPGSRMNPSQRCNFQ